MKIVRPICCGMDVHKDLIVATIATTNENGVTEYIQESFCTQNYDLFRLKNWLKEHNCSCACMESTGKYWIPIFNILEDEIETYIAHPKYTKAIKGKKTDKKDSKWIADLFKHDLIKFSFIPPKQIRELRELCRYRYKLVCIRSGEANRYQNAMTVSNIGLASVLSDVFGTTSQKLMNEVLSSDTINEQALLDLLDGKTKKKSKEILASFKDSKIEADQHLKMELITNHMTNLNESIEKLEEEILSRCLPLAPSFSQISHIPGISPLSAMLIVSEIGVNMDAFESEAALCSWAGLAPANNESANKKKSVRISKAGIYLKPLLVQCALAAIANKKIPYFRNKYEIIKKRRGHKKAIIAIARKLLVCVYHMILTGEDFNPSDLDKVLNPKAYSKKKELTPELALEFLASQGYDISQLSITQ